MSEHFISREQAENDMLSAAAYIAEGIKSGDGHAEAMNTIIPIYLSKGEVDLAAELANSVDDPYSRDKLLTIVAEKCAQIDDDEYALQLADAIEDHGLQSQALERIALVKAGKGNTEKAAEIADSMAHPEFVYAGIAVHQAISGDGTAAGATLEQIDFATARVFAMQQIASSAIEKDEAAKAVEWLEKAVDAAGDIEHDEEKIRAMCDIGNLFIEAERNDKAVATYDLAGALAERLDNVHRDLFLATCAVGFLFAGSSELADRTLDLVKDKTQMSSALLGFARESWKKDAKEDAIETLEESYAILRSQREAETRDSRGRNSLLTSIAIQFAGFGKTERGIEIALENPDPDQQMGALAQIAGILTMQKEDALARQTVDEIAEDANRLTALIGLADTKLMLGETESSLALLDEAATLADSIPQLGSRSGILNEIAARFADQGQSEKARAIELENLAIISEVRDDSGRAALLATTADVFDRAGIVPADDEKRYFKQFVRRADL